MTFTNPWLGDVPPGGERRGDVTATIHGDGQVTLAWPDDANCTVVGRGILESIVNERNRLTREVESLRATVRGLTTQTQAYVDRAAAEGARIVQLAAETDRLRAAIPDDIDPAHVRPMLRLLGPARMVLDQLAEALGGQAGPWMDEAADMAQRLVDWIGHPVTDEPAWATLPCEQDGACRACRPCLARVRAGYRPGLVDGAPVIDDHGEAGQA